MNKQVSDRKPITAPALSRMKADGTPITMLTAYDASLAAHMESAGVDVVLIGDSLGNVVQGHDSTLAVTVDDIIYHCRAVARSLATSLLVADLPFMSERDVPHTLESAARLMRAGGAAMVKVEGAGYMCDNIRALVERSIPVCAHLGLTPQSVHSFGGFKVQGRGDEAAERLASEARAVAEAGAAMLVLECVPAELAGRIRRELSIPVIGIGAGADCDGQVLVSYDMLGLTPGKPPKFSKDFVAESGSIPGAVAAYVTAVREGRFPGPEHAFA